MISYKQYLNETASHDAYMRAWRMDPKRRMPDVEEIILREKDATYACQYAADIIHGPWPEAEDLIASNPYASYRYAFIILHKRFYKGEPVIALNSTRAVSYAKEVIKNRWPEVEDQIRENRLSWKEYLEFFRKNKHLFSEEEKLQWLKSEGITDNLFEILKVMGMEPRVQENIIKRKPHLIGKIPDLDPVLAKRYPHELNVAGLDI